MKIFKVTEVDWHAGEDAASAVADYRSMVGAEVADGVLEEFGPPEEVPEAYLDRLTVTDVDEPGQPKHTFREVLNDLVASGRKAGFIATTEF